MDGTEMECTTCALSCRETALLTVEWNGNISAILNWGGDIHVPEWLNGSLTISGTTIEISSAQFFIGLKGKLRRDVNIKIALNFIDRLE